MILNTKEDFIIDIKLIQWMKLNFFLYSTFKKLFNIVVMKMSINQMKINESFDMIDNDFQ